MLPHLNAAYTLAHYLTSDASEAEDATKEAALRALRYIHTLRSDADARAWLLAIVHRECSGGRRRVAAVAFESERPDTEARHSMLQRRARAVVTALPERMRETLILRELQQCTYDEIATITEVPLSTVMSRLSRARARLAGLLSNFVAFDEECG